MNEPKRSERHAGDASGFGSERVEAVAGAAAVDAGVAVSNEQPENNACGRPGSDVHLETRPPQSATIAAVSMVGVPLVSFTIGSDKTFSDIASFIQKQCEIPSLQGVKLVHGGEPLLLPEVLSSKGWDLCEPVEITVVVQEGLTVQFVQEGMCRFPGCRARYKGRMTYEEAEAAFLADDECMYMDLARVDRQGKYDTHLFHFDNGHCDLHNLPPLEGPHNPRSGITFKKVYVRESISAIQGEDEVVFAQSGMCRFPGWKAKGLGYLTFEEAVSSLLADRQCMFMDMARPRGNKYDTFLFYDSTGCYSPGNLPCLQGPHDPESGTTFKKIQAQSER